MPANVPMIQRRVHATLSAMTIACSLLSFSAPAHADEPRPFLDTLFADNMVLQRGSSDPVWGWATPGTTVKVRLAGKGAAAVAGADGKWMAHLPPLPVGGPYVMTVSGPQAATVRNILVGDVWLCSGQSNMEFGVGNLLDPESVVAQASHPNIRLFTVEKGTALTPQATTHGLWQVCTPDTIKSQGTWNGFSAVAYFFGRQLAQTQHVPIGLMLSSYGGTNAEAWTSAPALARHVPDFRDAVAQLSQAAALQQTGALAQAMADWYRANDPGSARPGSGTDSAAWADPAFDDTGWMTLPQPGFWQQAGVPALAHVNGIGWFRKEINLPADDAGKPAVLHLLADDNDTAWVNGTRVGTTEDFSKPRAYPVPAGLLHAGRNIIAVRVLDTGGDGGLWGAPDNLRLDVPGTPGLPLAGPWQFHLSKSLAVLPPVPANIANNPNFSAELYNFMISPLIPFGIKGAIWYQGENNAGRAYQYRTLLPALITDWRKRWGEGPFPFLIVQLAGYAPGGPSWPELREAQALTAKNLPNVGLATAIDIGDATDIHPKNKQEVGHRLALVAQAQAYHQNVPFSGPTYATVLIQENQARLTFGNISGGLVVRGGGALSGFTIAGADRAFVPASARIEGSAIVVSSPQVSVPVAVRYAWSAYPTANLYNGAGLPAFPFRTDNWPGVTDHNK